MSLNKQILSDINSDQYFGRIHTFIFKNKKDGGDSQECKYSTQK